MKNDSTRTHSIRMRAVDKKKHEHLIRCLEELRLLAPEKSVSVEADIVELTEAYNIYTSLLSELKEKTDLYHSLYTSIQVKTYKDLRFMKKHPLEK